MKNQYIKIYDIDYGFCFGRELPKVIYTDVPVGVIGTDLTDTLENHITTVAENTCEGYRFERMTLTSTMFSETFKNLCEMILQFDPEEHTVNFITDAKSIRETFDTAWATWPGQKNNITDDAVDCFDRLLDILEQFKPDENGPGHELICLAHQLMHMIDEDDTVWKNTTPITYRDLLSVLVNMSESELAKTVTIQAGNEFFSASGYMMQEGDEHSDVIEAGTFVLTNNEGV